MPKAERQKATKPLRHNPLAEQIVDEEDCRGLRKTPRMKRRNQANADEDENEVLPSSVTRKVLEVAQAQKTEDEKLRTGTLDIDELQDDGDGIEDDEEICDVEVDEDGFIVTQGATEEEERALSLFMPGAASGQKAGSSLADMILNKIHEHENRALNQSPSGLEEGASAMSPKVIEVYGEIGKWLKHYKSGKIPKAFKVIPSLANWEDVLALTSPLTWSPAAMFEAVNIFASNLNPRMAQRFYNLILLPAVRDNIAQYKKLNFHYYRSLRKALFKPAAFFKGILIPLAQENCTLREAMILGSVMSKASIPPMHGGAVLVRLCAMTPWFGTTSVMIATLVNKKYALPLQVIETLVMHFCAFGNDTRMLPVVWHRALLLFVQRYKYDLSDDQRRRLKELLNVHWHEAISSEVRRELTAPKPGQGPVPTDISSSMDVS
jgi:essential nuclear protein 1|mmetsp:Transcript_65860/g.104326  ORF Transcript_65860/g.104326 Transcript_65860/m.104326 type:complete len:435 (-) Transcript_65860:104-1408(-)|eukprot:CAMPEP_0169139434 /NCGR_PEP_ID=MMETSP1015-20121227/42960_1 /TAXON_ID=342587 /ORGANISM="Karlodinium micrum, Strain CCMP2283" /LENGTH=434 /DNA_ID=CAMNT_0009205125 /DNA_START=83 /DNA_END=1387 /DNA_ORIENTATION=-